MHFKHLMPEDEPKDPIEEARLEGKFSCEEGVYVTESRTSDKI